MNNYCEFDNTISFTKENLKIKKFKNKVVLTRININSNKLSKKLEKNKGFYSTIYCENLEYDKNFYKSICNVLIKELQYYLKIYNIDVNKEKFFLVGFGNPEIPADKLGYLVCKKIISTSSFISKNKISSKIFSNTFSLCPLVESINGLATAKIVKTITKELNPNLVILIDAMTCNNFKYIGKTIQISTNGLTPGGEISNNNLKIDKKLLKKNVIAIGCPLVINSNNLTKNENKTFLTSKDIVLQTDFFSKIISYSLNKVIHKNLTKKDICFLTDIF